MNGNAERQLPAPMQEALAKEIDPNETVRWCGQPRPERVFWGAVRPSLLATVAAAALTFVFLWASLMTWRELSGLDPPTPHSQGQPSEFAIWAFAAFGCLAGAGTVGAAAFPWFAARQARRTVYAVTNTRVLALQQHARDRATLTAVEPGHPLHILRNDTGHGFGDIQLYPNPRGGTAQLKLIGIDNAREVERLIRATFDPK